MQWSHGFTSPFDQVANQRFWEWFQHVYTIKELSVPGLRGTRPYSNPAMAPRGKIIQPRVVENRIHPRIRPTTSLDMGSLKVRPIWHCSYGAHTIRPNVPAILNSMAVKSIPGPASTRFMLASLESSLACVLRRAAGANGDGHLTPLAVLSLVERVESKQIVTQEVKVWKPIDWNVSM